MGNCFEVETNPAPRTTYGTNKNEARPPVIVPLVASGASKHTNKNEARPASRHTTSVKKKRNTEVNSGLTLGNVGIEGNGGCGGGNDSGGGGGGSGGGGGGYGGGGGCYDGGGGGGGGYDGGGGGGGGCAGGF